MVIDPASLLVDRRAKRAKTDRIDARAMVRALMAWARGERQVLSEDLSRPLSRTTRAVGYVSVSAW